MPPSPQEKPTTKPPIPIPIPLPPATKSPPPQNLTGFSKSSTLVLFLLTVGIFAVFSAFNLIFAFPDDHRLRPNPPGELFWFREGVLWWGMKLHLYSVLPAGILLPLQFLPVMRRKFTGLHRWGGRLLFILLLIGNMTALSIARHSFGGTIDTQCATVCLASLTTFSVFKTWSSIKNLQIDKHRVWVLRTWSYACAILSLRVFMGIIANFTHRISPGGYRSVTTCEELIFMYQSVSNATSVSSLYSRYPACLGYEKAMMGEVYVIVNASFDRVYPEEKAALLNLVFGVSAWAAIVVHVLLTETYLFYTKDEDERLKKVSAIRRKAVGL